MKKKIILLALILISGISLVRSQPVTGLIPADMSSYKSNLAETTMIRDGNNLVVSVKAVTGSCPGCNDPGQIIIRIKFTKDTRKEFEQFAGVVSLGKLQLKMVDETTGKSTELLVNDDNYSDNSGSYYRAVITFPESHVYKFMLNGKVIGTGYKPK